MIEFDRPVELRLEVPRGKVFRYNLEALASAFDVDDPTRIAVEVQGRQALITIYPTNPLAEVRAVTRDDLVMDRYGRIAIGPYHNGRTARLQLFDFETGSAQRFLLFGTTGAGKSRALQMRLVAEKVNGIVSWVCDLKQGQSVPEAEGNVDWFGRTLEEAILMLRAAVRVAEERMARYSLMGRTAFLLGDPDPLHHVQIEEANRLLEKGSPYRDEATHRIKELGRTGRSVGVGVGLSAQASHLDELGGSDTLRAMLKEGEVTLLRWSSTMMRQLVADGLLPPGTQLIPIPSTLGTTRLRSQFDVDDVDEGEGAPGTQGSAYLLSSPHPTSLMRHFRIGSISPLPGLDPEILALYGDGEPARLEEASHGAAGEAYTVRHDRKALAALCDMLKHDEADRKATAAATFTAAGGGGGGGGGGVPRLLKDRVLAVLRSGNGEPMTAEAVLDAVNADGGDEVSKGAVRTALGNWVEDGEAERAGRGLYVAVCVPA